MTIPRLTHHERRRLRSLRVNATPGPWHPTSGAVVTDDPGSSGRKWEHYYGGVLITESCARADADLIAAAVNALIPLLDQLDELDAECGPF